MPKVAVAIKSCHKNHVRRTAQLATWIPQLECDFFFLIGNPTPANGGPVISDALSCDVPDAFDSIAPKVYCACKYALETDVRNLLICDDDTYVCASRLLKSGYARYQYVGFVRPYGDIANGHVPYMQGSAFWLGEKAMEHIVTSNEMRPKIIDDGAVGRALCGKVPYVHDARYWPGPGCEKVPTPQNDLITTHKATSMQIMEALHAPWRTK